MSSKTIIALVTEHCLKFKISTLLLPEKDIFILSKHIRHDFNNSALYVLWITNITRTFVLAKEIPDGEFQHIRLSWRQQTCQCWVDLDLNLPMLSWLIGLIGCFPGLCSPSISTCDVHFFFQSMDSWIQSQSQNHLNQWRSGIFSCCCNCGRSPCSGVDKHRLNRSRLYP